MVYEHVVAKEVVKNRQKIEEKLINKNPGITPVDLAEFFYCPLKAIEKDLDDLKLELYDKESWINIEKLRDHRDKMLLRKINSGIPERKALESFGLYRMPPEFKKDEIHREIEKTGLSDESIVRVERSLYNSAIGISISNSDKNLNLTKLEQEFIRKYKDDIESTKEAVENLEIDLVKSGQDVKTVAQMGGYYSEMTLSKTVKDGVKTDNRSKKNYQHNSKKDEEKNNLKEECYKRWAGGECTQQELAVDYGVTRVTIMNWMREKKFEHKDEEKDPLKRRRNIKSDQKITMDIKRDIICQIYKEDPDLTISEIAEITKFNWNFCKRTLIDAGLYATRYEDGSKETIKKGVKEAKRAYDRTIYARFGYGPNKDQSKEKSFSEYNNMLDGQKDMIVENEKIPELETEIKLGRGVKKLMEVYHEENVHEDDYERE